jgi:hypothetical protein
VAGREDVEVFALAVHVPQDWKEIRIWLKVLFTG